MKAIGYIRVSTNNQDIIRQTEKYKNFCIAAGYENIDAIVDDGKTGANFDREGYRRLQEITLADADIIVISELSRLSRKQEILDTLNSVQNIMNKGLKIIFLDDANKIYSGTLDIIEIVTLSIAAWSAYQDRLTIKSRNQDGKKALFNNIPNAVVDGKIPYGFDKIVNPAGNHPKYILQINEEEAAVVNTIFNSIMEGKSVAQTTHYLYNLGIRNRDNEIFSKQFISKLISNPLYKGERKRKNSTAKADVIIQPEIWEAVQVKVKENYLYDSNGTTMFNPLRGIIKCRCGRAMTVKNKGGNVLVYRCSDVKPAYYPNKCEYMDSIRFDLTNEVIFSLLRSIDFVEVSGNVQAKIDDYNNQITGITLQISEHKNQIIDINAELELLQERYISARSQSLADKVQENIIKYEDEVKKIEKTIEKKIRTIEGFKKQISSLKVLAKTEDFSNLDIKERAKLFKKYIKRIQYLPVTIMQGFYRVEFNIEYTAIIAVKKTTNSPIFSLVPNGITLNDDDTTLSVSTGKSDSNDPFNFSNYRNEVITIQQYFRLYGTNDLKVDLSYREKITE